jgi:SAM-dependent methyltransferase
MSNAQQAAYWTDTAGLQWVTDQQLFDHMLAPFGVESRRVLAAQPGEHVLDVGCGTATTTLAIAAAVGPTGSVVGCDISPTMIDAARGRIKDTPQVSLAIADAQTADLVQADPFDAVYSRFGVMFFADPVVAFKNIAAAVRPGGRLVFVCWQHEDLNEWISLPARIMRTFTPEPVLPPADAPGPFAFHDPARIEQILSQAGWIDVSIAPFSSPVVLGAGRGVDAAVQQSLGTRAGQGLRGQVDDETYERAVEAVRAAFAERANADGVVSFTGAVWVVTACRP